MKKTTFVVAMGLLALTTLAGCFEVENVAPNFDASSSKAAVQGKWFVDRVNNKVCRDNSCNSTQEAGGSQEYFEFKADSAYLIRTGSATNLTYCNAYRADYRDAGVILLSNSTRLERFEIKDSKQNKLVLQSVFTGRDPAAVFTDTYYLYR